MYRNVCVCVIACFFLVCVLCGYAVDWSIVISHLGRNLLVIGMQVYDVEAI